MKIKIPYLTRLAEIKEQQLKNEKKIYKTLNYILQELIILNSNSYYKKK